MTLQRLRWTFGLAAALLGAETASAQGRFFSRRPIYSSPRTPVYYAPPVIVSSPQPMVTTSDVIGAPTPVATIGRPAPEATTQWVEVDGYVAPVTSLRTDSGSVSSGPIESPHVAPDFAAGYTQRLRVVTADGEFHNRYYGANGQWIGSNAYGQPQMLQQMYGDAAQQTRRQNWGPAPSTPASRPSTSRRTSNAKVSNYAWSLINRNNQNYIPSGGGGSSSGGSSRSSSGGSGGGGGSYYYSE